MVCASVSAECRLLENDDRDDDVPVFGTVKCCAVEGYQTTCECVGSYTEKQVTRGRTCKEKEIQ